jgi:hypothetical protein
MRPKRELARRIPGARLEVIAGSGHVTPIDATERFNHLLLDFLDEVERGMGAEEAERSGSAWPRTFGGDTVD